MTRRVIGLDLSLTSCGIGIVVATDRGTKLVTDVVKSQQTKTGFDAAGKPKVTMIDRYSRLRDHSAAIIHFASRADLVVMEGLIVAPGGATQDRTALWWIVAGAVIRRDVPLAVVSPPAMKKAITGKGNADKVEIALAMIKLWPDTELGNNDSADAGGLAHLGAVALGWQVPTLERHRDVKWTEWPELVERAAVA